MSNIPGLDDLLNYGDEYKYPDIIISDYYKKDYNRKKDYNNRQQNQPQQTEEQSQEQDFNQQTGEQNSENDFDDLMNNYEANQKKENENNTSKGTQSPSNKLNEISTTNIYNILKKLVSLSYERFQKGTYKYNKKEIVKHYLTNQKFKIIDDLVSPTFNPDIYVFDLSPSNNNSLEMYVNAISSVAFKNSWIYLTYNECILRKLIIKKENAKGINVSEVANSQVIKYNNFDCIIFDEYQSLYEELRSIKTRKIYIFSDFDISENISKLSHENPDIVWFSTEQNNSLSSEYKSYFYSEYLNSYQGYYVEVSGIEDIEKFIKEKIKINIKEGVYNG